MIQDGNNKKVKGSTVLAVGGKFVPMQRTEKGRGFWNIYSECLWVILSGMPFKINVGSAS
jgi:hypothetical protein